MNARASTTNDALPGAHEAHEAHGALEVHVAHEAVEPAAGADPLATFAGLVDAAIAGRSLDRLVLSKPRTTADELIRVTLRLAAAKSAAPRLTFVDSHRTRDVTRHLDIDEARAVWAGLVGERFNQAQLFSTSGEAQLLTSRKGRRTLLRRSLSGTRPAGPAGSAPAIDDRNQHGRESHDRSEHDRSGHDRSGHDRNQHDRQKHRVVDPRAPFLTALGVTDAEHRLVPAMARKWKQINKFIEVLDHALDGTRLKQRSAGIELVDFGSGKGYLTFAAHEHLQRRLGLPARVTGVELREDMVALCNATAHRLGLDGLVFEQGDVRSTRPANIDVMIALHACDTATDHAIATGLGAGAAVIMCSPCCHKELRPQLLSPHPLRPILKHGVHLGQQAEMLTDTLRAMVLEACGYATQVFEFVALEHSQKNKMILAVRRDAVQHEAVRREAVRPETAATSKGRADAWRQIDELKAFYGIRTQCLEALLRGDRALPEATDV